MMFGIAILTSSARLSHIPKMMIEKIFAPAPRHRLIIKNFVTSAGWVSSGIKKRSNDDLIEKSELIAPTSTLPFREAAGKKDLRFYLTTFPIAV